MSATKRQERASCAAWPSSAPTSRSDRKARRRWEHRAPEAPEDRSRGPSPGRSTGGWASGAVPIRHRPLVTAARCARPSAFPPGQASGGDTQAFETVHTVLGTLVGETFGYLLTATWTVLIVATLGRRLTRRWFSILVLVAATLIAVGVLVPLGVPGTDSANFVGYIVWSLWLLGLAALIWRRADSASPARTRSSEDAMPSS